ncbi:phage tail domain-containing protein [Streptomyces sp. NPDC001404]|uniref:phage tail domain-containing protein n=2 Tax=unclassified Streptomyces TaxID=2593676 RepID=UPI0036863AE4
MPIPATRDQVGQDRPQPVPVPPLPMVWGHTYVSITGGGGEGEEIPLTSFTDRRWPGILLQAGATGLDTPPFELHADSSPNLDGSIYRSARAAAREVMLPVYLYGIDRRSLKELKRKLISALNPKRGYCVLKFIEADSQVRKLYCYYKGGMEGNESADNAGFRWVKYGIQLTAFDPWFYSDDLRVAEWQFNQGEGFLRTDKGLFPLRLNRGALADQEIPVINPGEVEAWPVWEIRGPVRSFTFTSPSGASFGITTPGGGTDVVPEGRVLTVNTRPGHKTISDETGRNYWPLLDSNPQLWPVEAGKSTVGVRFVAGNGPSSLKLTLRPRYESY